MPKMPMYLTLKHQSLGSKGTLTAFGHCKLARHGDSKERKLAPYLITDRGYQLTSYQTRRKLVAADLPGSLSSPCSIPESYEPDECDV